MSIPWTPFVRMAEITMNGKLVNLPDGHEFYKNSLYAVIKRPIPSPGDGWPDMFHLSIRSNDRSAVHDWRHLQRIKNELVGVECEAVELYPADSRLVDAANQFHLWCLTTPDTKFPFGFQQREVGEESINGYVQRRFDSDNRPSGINDEANRAATLAFMNAQRKETP